MENKTLPQLSSEEQRVLGALMEKARTTPEYYPLSLAGLVTACNQKTSRKPVVSYDDATVIQTIDRLRKLGLVNTETGGGSRVTKYKHTMGIVYPLVPAQLAVLCLLLLRGPLTPGEINSNAGRLFEFESLDDVQTILDQLSQEEPPFVQQLPKRPGQKEARYIHLLGEVDLTEEPTPASSASNQALEERLATVEAQLAALRAEFDQLMQQLT
jgi:uncharacterized protein YceH (UPF0502 family)